MHVELLILQSLTEKPLKVFSYIHVPALEQLLGHVFDGVKHLFCVVSHTCHTPQSPFFLHTPVKVAAVFDKAAALTAAHSSLLDPCEPTYAPPDKQGPHVCDLEEHGSRCNAVQFGAEEQLTALRTVLNVEIAFFLSSTLPPAVSASCINIIICKTV
jgi:hypothetical protein